MMILIVVLAVINFIGWGYLFFSSKFEVWIVPLLIFSLHSLVMVIWFTTTGFTAKYTTQQIASDTPYSIVGSRLGTVTVVDETTAITVNHLIEVGAKQLSVTFRNITVVADIVSANAVTDLVVLKFNKPLNQLLGKSVARVDLDCSLQPDFGAQTISIGYPSGVGPLMYYGSVIDQRVISVRTSKSPLLTDLFAETLIINTPLFEGMSGGPTIDVKGRLVGINSRKLSDPFKDTNLLSGIVVKTSAVCDALNQLKLKENTND